MIRNKTSSPEDFIFNNVPKSIVLEPLFTFYLYIQEEKMDVLPCRLLLCSQHPNYRYSMVSIFISYMKFATNQTRSPIHMHNVHL